MSFIEDNSYNLGRFGGGLNSGNKGGRPDHTISSYKNESEGGDLPDGVTESNLDFNFGLMTK